MRADKAALDANSASDTPTDKSAADEEARARKAAADSLRRQIQKLKEGRPPRSLNEFVEEQMAEEKKKAERSHD